MKDNLSSSSSRSRSSNVVSKRGIPSIEISKHDGSQSAQKPINLPPGALKKGVVKNIKNIVPT